MHQLLLVKKNAQGRSVHPQHPQHVRNHRSTSAATKYRPNSAGCTTTKRLRKTTKPAQLTMTYAYNIEAFRGVEQLVIYKHCG